MLFQTAIGIDIHTDKFNVVALKTRLNRILPAARATHAFNGDLSAGDRVKVIAEVLGRFVQEHRIVAADYFLGIPRQMVILREVRLPLSAKENLRTTLSYEMPKYIPLPVDEIHFDYHIFEEQRQENQLRLLLFAARRGDIEPYLHLATHLGQQLSAIEPPSTAMAAFLAMHPPAQNNGPFGLLRLDTGGGELCIYRNGLLRASQWIETPTAAEDAADRLMTAARAVEGRSETQHRWYCVAAGASHEVPAVFREGTPPLNIVPLDTTAAGLPEAQWATAYGLALRGLRQGNGAVNLLPPTMRKKPDRSAYYTLMALTAAVFLLAGAWGVSHLIRHRMAVAHIESELKHLRPRVAETESLRADNSRLEDRIQGLEALRRSRTSALVTLEELSARIPTTAWVEHLNFQNQGVRITGFADSASELVTLLEESPLFTNVVFLSAITRTRDGKERFQIGMDFENPQS
ncbi:PilN domain-containing protein [Desulfatitalea alkaliphila]|uniref:PilN domain-containing protein n=1 Tax=Desulfatitalea alkaliphila TaxID=2929485 RepID=A0AA41R233_9BACT|nr:PilN domain-containing protein [Desulfatitalea alkaliphila]MCJ8499376.1 PilN domain-containing protein [Desulfatitalea alkaliphila]